MFGIPTYEQPREHITQDGRRVIFDVKPPSVGIGGSSINAERRENTLLSSLDLFLAAETYAADEQLTLVRASSKHLPNTHFPNTFLQTPSKYLLPPNTSTKTPPLIFNCSEAQQGLQPCLPTATMRTFTSWQMWRWVLTCKGGSG